MLGLATLLKAGKLAVELGGAALVKAPEFKALWDQGVAALHPKDQATAKQGYQDLIAENAEGFERLDAKLAAAEGR